MDKTEWGTDIIVFLGILLNGRYHFLAVPESKKMKALNSLKLLSQKKKGVVRDLQSLAGLLNFLNRVIVPGRAFTRRMYVKFSGCFSLPNDRAYHTSSTKKHLKALPPCQPGCRIQARLYNVDTIFGESKQGYLQTIYRC